MIASDQPESRPPRCSFEIGPHVRYLPIVRLFVGSVARQWDASEDVVSDLRVGASELAAAAMVSESPVVRIEMIRRREGIEVAISPLTADALEAGDEPAADVVGGLFDSVVVTGDVVSIRTDQIS